VRSAAAEVTEAAAALQLPLLVSATAAAGGGGRRRQCKPHHRTRRTVAAHTLHCNSVPSPPAVQAGQQAAGGGLGYLAAAAAAAQDGRQGSQEDSGWPIKGSQLSRPGQALRHSPGTLHMLQLATSADLPDKGTCKQQLAPQHQPRRVLADERSCGAGRQQVPGSRQAGRQSAAGASCY
jgi:hypothetical protein